jgi:SAM-dependent methyltransferase
MTESEVKYRAWMTRIFTEKKSVIDIGGGLRIRSDKGDRYNKSFTWLAELAQTVNYQIMDPVDTFHPDIVGDIHHMPFPDNSIDAIICSSVLEHVTNPFLAVQEIYRTLKPGGYLYLYVPFLYYYHPERGYYGDYWRFTEEGLRELCKAFSHIEVMPIRGALETWVILNPYTRFLENFARVLDRILKKDKTKQVSAYAALLRK